jgi:ribose-phosphate pyrophosphokinase
MDGLSVPAHGFKLIAGPGNPDLCGEIARMLDVPFCKTTVNRFADGEIFVRIDENVRGNDVFIVQPTNPPAENIMELLLLIDADRKDQPRVAIGAKLLANMITVAGANRVLGIDFHQHQLQGFFDVPVDHLYAAPVFVSHYRKKDLHDLVVVAPDVGSAKMARGFAKRLNGSLAIIDKRRPKPNVSEVVNVVGEVEGRDCLLTDDMIDTAGTVSEAAIALKDLGARDIYVCATHALLSGPSVERLSKAPIKEVTVTDTVMIPKAKRFSTLCVLSVGDLLAKAIRYIHSEQSVSSLFEQ